MIIICNNCTGARIYLLLLTKFNNPFIWCRIVYKDMIYLIENFKTINFLNYKLVSYHDNMLKQLVFRINVDNKITIWYPHYKYSEIYEIPTKNPSKNGLDIYYKDIQKYILDKYIIRTNRMLESIKNGENILFIVVEDNKLENMNYTFDNIKSFLKYNIPILTQYDIKDKNIINIDLSLSTVNIANLYLSSNYKI